MTAVVLQRKTPLALTLGEVSLPITGAGIVVLTCFGQKPMAARGLEANKVLLSSSSGSSESTGFLLKTVREPEASVSEEQNYANTPPLWMYSCGRSDSKNLCQDTFFPIRKANFIMTPNVN